MNKLIAMAALAVAFVIAAPSAAHAQTMTCEVVEIVATKTGSPSVDPQLKDVAKKLKSKAFSAWDTFTQRARLAKQVAVLKAETFGVPGGTVTLTIEAIKKRRLSLDLEIVPNKGKGSVKSKGKVSTGDFLLFARGDDAGAVITAIGCK